MYWRLITLCLLCLTSHSRCSEEGGGNESKRKAAVVVGTVYCGTCFPTTSYFISGASVQVRCKSAKGRPDFRQEVKTNEHGVFRVALPFRVKKNQKKVGSCLVKTLNSNEPHCTVPSVAASAFITLISREGEAHIFSSGDFSFVPMKRPKHCGRRSNIRKHDTSWSQKTSALSFSKPSFPSRASQPELPPLVALPPSPLLPPLPTLRGKLSRINRLETPENDPFSNKKTGSLHKNKGIRYSTPAKKMVQPQGFFPPNPFQPPSIFPPNPFQPPPSIFPPNPFQPPPSILPPNPFQPPSPPPSIFPPNPFQPQPPPPAPLIPPLPPLPSLPPIPGLKPPPSPPPPPPPSFSFPPFPFPPLPVPPGPPPASSLGKKPAP